MRPWKERSTQIFSEMLAEDYYVAQNDLRNVVIIFRWCAVLPCFFSTHVGWIAGVSNFQCRGGGATPCVTFRLEPHLNGLH